MHESQMAINLAGCSPGPTAESDGMGVEMVGPRGELASPRLPELPMEFTYWEILRAICFV
jgi:hypothetical protein